MEEIFGFIFLAVIFFGYLALCAGVGYFAHKNDQSFVLFFILAIIFSPIPVFVVVIIVSVATGTLGASHERKEQGISGQEEAQPDGRSSSNGGVGGKRDDDLEPSSVQEATEEKGTDDAMSVSEGIGSEEVESPVDTPDEEDAPEEGDEDEPYPWEEEDSGEEEQQPFGDEWEETDDSDLSGEPEAPEGKVRCDVCHSFVDETEERCPACGNRLD